MTLPGASEGKIAPHVPFLFLAIASGLGIAGKLPLIQRLTHIPQPVAAAMVACGLCLPFLWRFAVRYRRIVAPIFMLGVLIASVLIYPKIVSLHAEGRGSDQADCVVVAAREMSSLRYPYGENLLWSGHPMSCGPGWVLLQAPAVRLAGYRFNLILLWTLSLLTLKKAIGRERTLAFAALLAFAPGVWLAAADGSDFVTFGVVLAAIVAAAGLPGRAGLLAALAGALAFQFRPPMVLLAGFLRRPLGWGRALAVGLAAILLQMLFALAAPFAFTVDGPFFLWHKLAGGGALLQHPILLSTLLSAGLILGLLLALRTGRFVQPVAGARGFLLLLLVPMATLDLIRYMREFGFGAQALGLWEGGVWLSACVPLAALALALQCPVTDATEA